MSATSLEERKVKVTVQVSRPDADGEVVPEIYTFLQHRMRISVRQGGAQFGNARVEIFGAPLDTMNTIARLWLDPLTPLNNDTLSIDVWDGLDYVPFFSGVITWSGVNGMSMPAVSLLLEANSGFALMNAAASPYSNAGPVTLKDAVTAIAAQGNFEVDYGDDAINPQLIDVRVTGSPMEQIHALMNQFPALTWSNGLSRLLIRSVGAPFNAEPITVSIQTGLMQLPTYSSSGLQFDTLFNPRLMPGRACQFETAFDFVNETLWVASVLIHNLDPNMPGGQWTTSCAANAYGPIGNNQ